MDGFTFGNSKGAVNLINVLGKPENSAYSHRVSSILSKYMTSVRALMFIPHKETRETALKLWRERFLKRIEDAGFPTVVKSHTENVVVGEYRKLLKDSTCKSSKEEDRMKKYCRTCMAKGIEGHYLWTLKSKGEPDRHYCSLSHLAEEVNEALEKTYYSPDVQGLNAQFYKELK